MTESDPVEEIKDGIANKLLTEASTNPDLRAAGSNVGKAALTLSQTLNTCLLPLAALNFAVDSARDYFNESFSSDLEAKAGAIAPENLTKPKASVAGPALQGLAFSHDEESLRDLYLSLISSAMNMETADEVHPAFAEIIRQLSGDEALLLKVVLGVGGPLAIVEIRFRVKKSKGYHVLLNHLLPLSNSDTNEPIESPPLPSMVDNWIRLGLVTAVYDRKLEAPGRYDWAEDRPELQRLRDQHPNEEASVVVAPGVLNATEFGKQFARVVGIQ